MATSTTPPSTRKFEAHITFDRTDAAAVEFIAKTILDRWAFSQIDGDPVMGQRPYCYLTRYDVNAQTLALEMGRAVGACYVQGVKAVREKIEEILFDSKTGVNNMERDCG